MATTRNLSLTLLEGPSVVDYGQLNSWMTALDNLGKEYVIENGTNGSWWFRQWNSGRAECGIDNNLLFNSLNFNNTMWPPLIICGRQQPLNSYPITFKARPYFNWCFNYSEPDATLLLMQSSQAGANTPPPFTLARAAEGASIIRNIQMSCFCTGRTV